MSQGAFVRATAKWADVILFLIHLSTKEYIFGAPSVIVHTILRIVSGNEPMKEILQYLKKHGEQLDTEIAVATGISLINVRLHLSELAAKGEVMACLSIRFEKGKKIEE